MNYQPQILLDGKPVEKITAFLFPKGGNENPKTLLANAGKSFVGSYVLGMGFTFDDTNENATPIATMHQLIAENPKNQDRIFPYIGGEEVNSSSTHSHHRYVINFGEMSEDEAREYSDLMTIVEAKVKPERMKLKQDNSTQRRRSECWWQFGGSAKSLYATIVQCDRVLVIPSSATKYLNFVFLPSNIVFSHKLIVFPLTQFSHFSVLQSRTHLIWTTLLTSTMKDDLTYNPTDCFQTFPFPDNWETDATLEAAGEAYYTYRALLLINNNQGLTTTYNRFHDPQETDPAILKLRDLHSEMDQAVLTAYGWHDIGTTCEFILDYEDEEDTITPDNHKRSRKKPYRYRWTQAIHDEVLARLLDLNQKRYDQEIIGGAGKGGKKKREEGKKKTTTRKSQPAISEADRQLALIPEPIEQLDVWSQSDF